jgi:hypothetical protein
MCIIHVVLGYSIVSMTHRAGEQASETFARVAVVHTTLLRDQMLFSGSLCAEYALERGCRHGINCFFRAG